MSYLLTYLLERALSDAVTGARSENTGEERRRGRRGASGNVAESPSDSRAHDQKIQERRGGEEGGELAEMSQSRRRTVTFERNCF